MLIWCRYCILRNWIYLNICNWIFSLECSLMMITYSEMSRFEYVSSSWRRNKYHKKISNQFFFIIGVNHRYPVYSQYIFILFNMFRTKTSIAGTHNIDCRNLLSFKTIFLHFVCRNI